MAGIQVPTITRLFQGAQVCKVAPTSCMDTQICVSSNALSRKRPITARFTGHSRIAGSQYGTCLMSPVWIHRIWRWLLDIRIFCESLGYPVHDCTDGRDDVHSNATSTDIKDARIYAFIPTHFFHGVVLWAQRQHSDCKRRTDHVTAALASYLTHTHETSLKFPPIRGTQKGNQLYYVKNGYLWFVITYWHYIHAARLLKSYILYYQTQNILRSDTGNHLQAFEPHLCGTRTLK